MGLLALCRHPQGSLQDHCKNLNVQTETGLIFDLKQNKIKHKSSIILGVTVT